MDVDTDKVGARTDIPVRFCDLRPFIKRECRLCDGSGELRIAKPQVTRGRNRVTGAKYTTSAPGELKDSPCGCGLRRFQRVQSTWRDSKTGRLFFAEPVVAWSPAGQHAYQAEQAEAKAAQARTEVNAGLDAAIESVDTALAPDASYGPNTGMGFEQGGKGGEGDARDVPKTETP
jgi:hypothetical protein